MEIPTYSRILRNYKFYTTKKPLSDNLYRHWELSVILDPM